MNLKGKKEPVFAVLERNNKFFVIKDMGPWDVNPSITNGAEETIANLHKLYGLGDEKVIYFDSENDLGELRHDGKGHFRGFAPVANYPFVMEDDVCGD